MLDFKEDGDFRGYRITFHPPYQHLFHLFLGMAILTEVT